MLTPSYRTTTQPHLIGEIFTKDHTVPKLDELVSSDSENLMHSDGTTESYLSDVSLNLEDFNGFNELVDGIKQVLGPSSGINTDDINTEALMEIMRQYKSNRADWEKYAFENYDVPYTRNGVDTINSKANLLVLVWTPGKGSAIHDHANAHCIVKVLQGSLRETLYDAPHANDTDLHVSKITDVKVDDVTYMSDTLGLHRMENVGNIPAVSLHLYTPPWAAKYGCNVYEKDASKHHVSMSTLYSDKGVLLGRGDTC